MILAFNRCCVMYDPKGWAASLFEGKRIWFWIAVSLIYGCVGAVLSKPILFSSIYVAFFFNPHMGYFEDSEQVYVNIFHTLNNFTVFFGLTTIYLIFFVLIIRRRNKYQITDGRRLKKQLSLFLQIGLISVVYAFTSGVYIYIQFFKSSELVILAGSYTFLFAQGVPPIFYTFLNKTIQKGLKKSYVANIIETDGFCQKHQLLICRLVNVMSHLVQRHNAFSSFFIRIQDFDSSYNNHWLINIARCIFPEGNP
uniref:7TM GPCR serpentine receptor class x (Srx) domain-containing protein n=1 Tax=Ditylenchus dipsaci TaxID=166011 RepID=A0A915D3G1_9BILA